MLDFPEFNPVSQEQELSEDTVAKLEYNQKLLTYRKEVLDLKKDSFSFDYDEEKRRIDLEQARIALEKSKIELYTNENRAFVSHGRFTLLDVVNGKSVDPLIKRITDWHSFAEKDKPLTFIINSPGGSVYDGMALFDTLKQVSHDGREVRTVATGFAASMGGVLLQAGDRRIMTPNSYVMIHEVSSGDYGSTSQLRDTVEHMEALENHIVEIFLSRVKISRKRFLENWNRREWWLGSAEAVKVGIADEVGYA